MEESDECCCCVVLFELVVDGLLGDDAHFDTLLPLGVFGTLVRIIGIMGEGERLVDVQRDVGTGVLAVMLDEDGEADELL